MGRTTVTVHARCLVLPYRRQGITKKGSRRVSSTQRRFLSHSTLTQLRRGYAFGETIFSLLEIYQKNTTLLESVEVPRLRL